MAVSDETHQSCPTTNSAQNMVPCATQYRGQAHQVLSAYAPAARPTTMATSRARWPRERSVFFSQQCLGMASRMSVRVNGGGADRS